MEETKCDSLFLPNQNNNLRQCIFLFNKVPKHIVCRTNIKGNTMVIQNEKGSVFIKDQIDTMSISFIRNSKRLVSMNTNNYNEIVNHIVKFLY